MFFEKKNFLEFFPQFCRKILKNFFAEIITYGLEQIEPLSKSLLSAVEVVVFPNKYGNLQILHVSYRTNTFPLLTLTPRPIIMTHIFSLKVIWGHFLSIFGLIQQNRRDNGSEIIKCRFWFFIWFFISGRASRIPSHPLFYPFFPFFLEKNS